MRRVSDRTEAALIVDGVPVVPNEEYSIRFERPGGAEPSRAVLLYRGEPVVSQWRLTLVVDSQESVKVS
jgi:hypothetical protein